ncbi:O-methyltransferase MdmC-like [Apostichopus japonicus]|uniref:O-methyltransferase MdmC-like n=1 Tax=Stichopus japonicus TaxID=307972 RepID=UPI003AB41FE9
MERPRYSRVDGCLRTVSSQLENIMEMVKLKTGCEDVQKKLQETLDLATTIEPYCVTKSTHLSPFLSSILEHTVAMDFKQLYQAGKLEHNFKHGDSSQSMISFSGQVQFLQFLVRKIKAKNILEIGTFMGYAAFGMAEAMAPGGSVTGIDIEPLFCDFVNELAVQKDINIEVMNGDALQILKQLAEADIKYDVIYIDCVKRDYYEYYKIIMSNEMLSSDGLIVCDRVILGGASISRKNHDGVALDNFSNRLLNDQRVTTVLLPCFDGTLLIQNRS